MPVNRTASALTISALVAITGSAVAEDRVIFQTVSKFNPVIVTEDEHGIRTLWFEKDSARQSVVRPGDPDYLDLAYAKTMPVGLALVDEPSSILVIGVGGGTIPMFLRKHYPDAVIHAVDIDPVVISVARRYFGFREDARMKAVVADGRAFIEGSPGRYDLIFLDAYGPDSVPYHLTTREFLQAVRRALTARGAVAANVWSSSHNPLYDSMVHTYREVFGGVAVVASPGAGNRIILAKASGAMPDRTGLERTAAGLSKKKSFPMDLGDIVRSGWMSLPRFPGRGKALLDGRKNTR